MTAWRALTLSHGAFWVLKSMKRMESVKAGMKRADLLRALASHVIRRKN